MDHFFPSPYPAAFRKSIWISISQTSNTNTGKFPFLTFPCDIFQLENLLHSLPRGAPHHSVALRQGLLRGTPEIKIELDRLAFVLEICQHQLGHKVLLCCPHRAECQRVRSLVDIGGGANTEG